MTVSGSEDNKLHPPPPVHSCAHSRLGSAARSYFPFPHGAHEKAIGFQYSMMGFTFANYSLYCMKWELKKGDQG